MPWPLAAQVRGPHLSNATREGAMPVIRSPREGGSSTHRTQCPQFSRDGRLLYCRVQTSRHHSGSALQAPPRLLSPARFAPSAFPHALSSHNLRLESRNAPRRTAVCMREGGAAAKGRTLRLGRLAGRHAAAVTPTVCAAIIDDVGFGVDGRRASLQQSIQLDSARGDEQGGHRVL